VGVAALLVALAACAHPGRREFDSGKEWLESGKTGFAISNLEDAVRKDPRNQEYAYWLNVARIRASQEEAQRAESIEAQDPTAALKALNKAHSLAPSDEQLASRIRDLSARIEGEASQCSSLAAELGQSRDAFGVSRAAVLALRASHLEPERSDLASTAQQLRSDVERYLRVGVIIHCSGRAELCHAARAEYSDFIQSRMRPRATVIATRADLLPFTSSQILTLNIDIELVTATIEQPRSGKSKQSDEIVAIQHVINPTYLDASRLYNQAVDQLQALKISHAANPPASVAAAVIYSYQEENAAQAVNSASALLSMTPMYVESPIKRPYDYVEYEFGAAAKSALRIGVTDNFTGEVVANDTWKADLSPHWIVRSGVSAQDANHLSPTDGESHTASELEASVFTKALLDAERTVEATVDDFLYRRWIALKGAEPGLALTALALYRTTMASEHQLTSISDGELVQRIFSESRPALLRDRGPRIEPVMGHPERESSAKPLLSPVRRVSVRPHAPLEVAPGATLERLISTCQSAVVQIDGPKGSGSGFFVSPDGLILTNEHVVEGAAAVVVRSFGGEVQSAHPIHEDVTRDLALLKVDEASGYLRLANLSTVALGEEVVAIGAPEGLAYTATRGIVSQIRRTDDLVVIQHDAAINPGNSGGPLLDRLGRVVGINTLKVQGEGLGFAISAQDAKQAFPELSH
jgi:S1-C subfamily serine protease